MKITITGHDAEERSVSVSFADAGVVHRRTVNARYDALGKYDEAGTIARVNDVGRGVAVKIAAGAITNTPSVIGGGKP